MPRKRLGRRPRALRARTPSSCRLRPRSGRCSDCGRSPLPVRRHRRRERRTVSAWARPPHAAAGAAAPQPRRRPHEDRQGAAHRFAGPAPPRCRNPHPLCRPATGGRAPPDDGRLSPTRLTAGRPGPIQASLQRFEASASRIGDPGPLGAVTGTGGQMGPLFFDPQGADFTEWVQRFKTRSIGTGSCRPVRRARRHRTGRLRVRRRPQRDHDGGAAPECSGTPAYDRAARNALLASRLLPLPEDFAPATVADEGRLRLRHASAGQRTRGR